MIVVRKCALFCDEGEIAMERLWGLSEWLSRCGPLLLCRLLFESLKQLQLCCAF